MMPVPRPSFILTALCGAIVLSMTAHASPSDFFILDGYAVDSLKNTSGSPHFTSRLPRFPLSNTDTGPLGSERFKVDPIEAFKIQHGKVRRNILLAEQYMSDGKWREALLEVQDGLIESPNNIELQRQAAVIQSEQGNLEEAEFYINRLLRTAPTHTPFIMAGIGIKLRLGKDDQAGELIQRAKNLTGEDLTLIYHDTVLKKILNDPTGAPGYWRLRSRQALHQIIAWLQSDQKYWMTRLSPKAFNELSRLMTGLDSASLPTAARLLQNLNRAYQLEQWSSVMQTTRLLQELGLHDAALTLDLARAYFEQDEKEEAFLQLQQTVERHSNYFDGWYTLGFAYLLDEAYRNAQNAFFQGLRIQPDSSLIQFAIAVCYAALDNKTDAWQLLYKVAEDAPEKLAEWIQGDAPYLDAIHQDMRYSDICRKIGIPPELE